MKCGKLIMVCGLALSLGLAGCRPYDTPELEEVAPNETAFAIPMEADTTDQTVFQSEEYLKKNMVAAKRIQIPHRWVQQGRAWFSGEYVDTVRVIKVDRSPITRYWTNEMETGSNKKSEGFEVETNDSVTLILDITCTAMIDEPNTPIFLYRYPVGKLEEVMDQEIRARIQTELTSEIGKASLEEVKTNKSQYISNVRERVFKYFGSRGLTITTLGSAGGLNYRNPAIQQAIDKTVQDQQLVISAEARFQAQLTENKTIKAAAEASADAAKIKAEGEKQAISLMGDSYILLRQLEVQKATLEKWNGQLPVYNMGNGSTPNLLLTLPNRP